MDVGRITWRGEADVDMLLPTGIGQSRDLLEALILWSKLARDSLINHCMQRHKELSFYRRKHA